jgi:tricorn protease
MQAAAITFGLGYVLPEMRYFTLLIGMSAVIVFAGFLTHEIAHGQTSASPIVRELTISASEVAFLYADDIWISPRRGGMARRLVSKPGAKSTPRFSPDGHTIAFAGNLDGQESIYTVETNSGTVTQITHAAGNTNLCGWTPDGKILYMTNAFAPWFHWRVRTLYTVPSGGGLPHPLPLSFSGEGAVSPDGRYLAYANYGIGLESWKRYRGGYAPDIWLMDLTNSVQKRITSWDGLDSTPMWHGSSLYYVSDRGAEQKRNIWSYDLRSGKHRQLTAFADFDVTSPSIGPGEAGDGEIIFQHGTQIGLLNLQSGKSTNWTVPLPPQESASRTETVDFSRHVQNWQVDLSGKRAVAEARGDLWLLTDQSPAVNLTKSSGSAERTPAWSHDGKRIAYFSDASGEYQLQIMDIETGLVHQVTKLGNGYRESPVWSPDDTKIAFYDSSGATYIYRESTADTIMVARNQWGREHRLDYSWSRDGKWFAFVLDEKSQNSAIWLYEVDTGKSRRITSGAFRDREPVFDQTGDYLYFLSTRDFSDLQYDRVDYLTFVARRSDVVMVLPLRDDIGLPWNRRPAQGPQSAGINFAGLERRGVRVPGGSGYLSRLSTLQGGRLVTLNSPPGESASLLIMHIQPGGPPETVQVSSDFQVVGEQTLFQRTAEGISEVTKSQPRTLRFADMTSSVDLKAEWHQLFHDAWRFTRDFFSDKSMNGRDWQKIGASYESWVSQCATRADLNYVLTEMIGELGSSHTYVGDSGVVAASRQVDVGMLGVDYVLHEGTYQIAKIYEGAPWDADARNPLRRPGITVATGDYLLRVNGKPVDTSQDPWAAFVGLANRPVTLTLSAYPVLDERVREVTVVPIRSETTLRNRAWIEANRELVSRQTAGRVGYLYLPDTYFYGTRELLRQLSSQMDKEALIVDARWNEGGLMPDRLIELLSRPHFYNDQRQFSLRSITPVTAQTVPKCLLTNAMSLSGGDSLALYFQRQHIGPVIGTRTTGAGGGAGGPTPSLIDGGRVEIRWIGTFDAQGGPGLEGRGIAPDIAIEDAPAALYSGTDKQLQAAIDAMNRALRGRKAVIVQNPAPTENFVP